MILNLNKQVNSPQEKDMPLSEALRVLSRILDSIEKIGTLPAAYALTQGINNSKFSIKEDDRG